MNNLTLGNDGFTYYETIGGGQGACPDADGPSGVHVTMSNTLSTPDRGARARLSAARQPPRAPLGLRGGGAHRGGDGVVREIEALEACRFSIVSERRAHAPGARGGGPAQPGRNLLNGGDLPRRSPAPSKPGDILRIETPGGGGYGRA